MNFIHAAFGQGSDIKPPNGPNPPGAPNPQMQPGFMTVFEPSEFAALWAKVVAAHAARKPALVHDVYTVVDNPHWGITGGWKVEILWVIGLPIAEWQQALPATTSAHLPTYFPNYVSSEIWTHFEIGALSQYGSWVTENFVVQEMMKMLAEETTH